MARNPKMDITPEERHEWYRRLAWEKELDWQKENRLRREGLFWKDPVLEALDQQDRSWEVVQMGFQQVADFLEGLGMPQYYDYFIAKGFTYGAKLRWMTRKYLEKTMTSITGEEEKEAILDACANVCRDEDIRLFPSRYGDPDQHLWDCHRGRALISEKMACSGWFAGIKLLSAAQEKDVRENRFVIPKADYDTIDDWETWVLAIDASGRGFLFPRDSTKVPPCIRNPKLHHFTAIDIAMDWKSLRSVSTGMDSRICFYDWKKDKPIHELLFQKVISGKVSDCFAALDASFEMERMVVGSNTGHLYSMDLTIAKPVLVLPGHKSFIRRVRANWNHHLVASASVDCYLNIYDLRNGKAVWKLPHERRCDAMDVDFDQSLAVCAPKDKATKLWDLKMGRCIKEFVIPEHSPNWINVNWATSMACTAADDSKVKLWDLETGEVCNSLHCQHDLTQCLDVDWKHGLLLTGSFDSQIKLWDMESASLTKQFVQPNRCLTRVCLQ